MNAKRRIGLSYHEGRPSYDAYPAALQRRAQALGLEIETTWLAGSDREARLDLLNEMDALVLTGGADIEPDRYGCADPQGLCESEPERDAIEWQILAHWRKRPIPALGICRGAQILNVFQGGSLIPDLAARNAVHKREMNEHREHGVTIARESRLHAIVGSPAGQVNSSHHQAVQGLLAPGFRACAWSDDEVIEAFEWGRSGDKPFLLAVQWHPEAMEPGMPLADRVLDAVLSEKH